MKIYFSEIEVQKNINKPEYLGGGFDAVRLFLAIFIFYVHAGGIFGTSVLNNTNIDSIYEITGHSNSSNNGGIFNSIGLGPYVKFLSANFTLMAVPMFFALSGYLVAGSSERTKNIKIFLYYRILRIVPALSVEVLISALIIGPIFTKISLSEYFTDYQFFRYFLNIFGIVTYHLPGVFIGNPIDGIVNWNLWTLPGEFYCYLFLSVCMLTSIFYNRLLFTIVVLLYYSIIILGFYCFGLPIMNGHNAQPFFLVAYFSLGSVLYLYRKSIKFELKYTIVTIVISYAILSFNIGLVFLPIFLVYSVIGICSMPIPFPNYLRRNDLSYGIYLYGFPVTQAMFVLLSDEGLNRRTFILISFLLTVVVAFISWIYIEKPALKHKNIFNKKEISPLNFNKNAV